jgi:hypothetical protein
MVQPMPIRREQPPDDAVVVVRAGVMDRRGLEEAASRCFDGYGILGISVEAAINTPVATACRTSRHLIRYRHVRLSTFGQLRTSGFAVVATFAHPHFTVTLADLSELTIARLDRCFDEPIPNPGRPGPGYP